MKFAFCIIQAKGYGSRGNMNLLLTASWYCRRELLQMSLKVINVKPSKLSTCVSDSMKIVVLKISSEFEKNTFPNLFSNIKLRNSFWEVRIRFWNQEHQSNFVLMYSILYISHMREC
jgi:hypothetical protein